MSDNKDFKIIGHRGAPVYAPENTLSSFAKAIEQGVDMIEFDVRLTYDGKVVVIHDRKVDRTTNGKGKVADLTLREIRKLKIGDDEKIPTLDEVFDLIQDRCEVNIEIKDPHTLWKILSYINNKATKKKILVSSNSFNLLKKARSENPELRLGVVAPFSFGIIKLAHTLKVESIHPIVWSVNKGFVCKAHKNNLKVYPYPWGTKEEDLDKVKKIVDLEIDGIFLNKTDILKQKTT